MNFIESDFDAMLTGQSNSRVTVIGGKLGENTAHIRIDRMWRDVEDASDLAVTEARGGQIEHLLLAWG